MKRLTPEARLTEALLVEAIGTISRLTNARFNAERIPGTRQIPHAPARREIRRNRAWLAKARKAVKG